MGLYPELDSEESSICLCVVGDEDGRPAGVCCCELEDGVWDVSVKPCADVLPAAGEMGYGGAEGNLRRIPSTPELELKARIAKAVRRIVAVQRWEKSRSREGRRRSRFTA